MKQTTETINLYDVTLKRLLLLLFILYSITGIELKFKAVNIPIGDVIAMIVAVTFCLKAGTRLSLSASPQFNSTGLAWYGGFIVVCLLGLTWSKSFDVSSKFLFRKPIFYSVVYFIAVGGAIIYYYRENKELLYRHLAYSTILISLISIITSLLRIGSGQIWGIMEIAKVTNNHKTLAITLAAHVPFLLSALKLFRHSIRFYTITLFLAIVAIVLSMAKAAWLALLLTIIFYLYFSITNPKKRRFITIFSSILVATITITGTILLSQNTEVVRGELGRLFLLLHTYNMFSNAPFLGNGPGTFMVEFQQYDRIFSQKGFPTATELDAHGLIFKLVSETGIIGLLFFLVFYFRIIKSVRNDDVQFQAHGAFLALLILFFLNSFFGTDTFSPRMWFPLTVAAVHRYL